MQTIERLIRSVDEETFIRAMSQIRGEIEELVKRVDQAATPKEIEELLQGLPGLQERIEAALSGLETRRQSLRIEVSGTFSELQRQWRLPRTVADDVVV